MFQPGVFLVALLAVLKLARVPEVMDCDLCVHYKLSQISRWEKLLDCTGCQEGLSCFWSFGLD